MNRAEPISCWIFDLDGTLSDPQEGMLASFNYALAECGLAPLAPGALRPYIGPPLEETFSQLANSDDSALIDKLIQLYRAHYKDMGYALNTVYPGIPQLLEQLKTSQQKLGVCTAKTEPVATRILENHGLLDHFEFVSGGDVGVSKSSQLETLLDQALIDTAAIMIGDRRYDIEAANTQALNSCGVLWGFGSREELLALSPTYLVDRPAELLSLLSADAELGGIKAL